MSILRKILVLTFMYEIAAGIAIITGFFANRPNTELFFADDAAFVVAVFCCNYSMYLMQQHNDKEYKQFLRFVDKLKLQYICCCCKSVINDAGIFMQDNMDQHVNEIRVEKRPTLNTFDTRNISIDDPKIATNGCELSIASTMHQ